MILKRIIAYAIDYIILWVLILSIIAIGYSLTGFMEEQQIEIFVLVGIYTLSLLILLYVSLKDFTFRDASIGKMMMKIHVVSTINKQRVLYRQLFARNLVGAFLFPIEFILLITGQTRMGDHYAKTKVIENKYQQ